MQLPILLPELGVDGELVRINGWLVDLGDFIEAGDRVVEVVVRGISFDVSAPRAGILTMIQKRTAATVTPGDILGWIEPETATESHT